MHDLQALITAKKNQAAIKARWPTALFLDRPQDLVLIPLTRELQNELKTVKVAFSDDDDFAEEWEEITPRHAAVIRTLSADLKIQILALETMYHGGQGFQDAVLWKSGELIFPKEDATHPINDMLKFLGVRKTAGVDEFDTVALGILRSTEKAAELAKKG